MTSLKALYQSKHGIIKDTKALLCELVPIINLVADNIERSLIDQSQVYTTEMISFTNIDYLNYPKGLCLNR